MQNLSYTYPVNKIGYGHCYGNSFVFATLDSQTNLPGDTGTVRYGLRESTNQRYYLNSWQVDVIDADDISFMPVETTFTPVFQETLLKTEQRSVRKRFFVPFENHHLRSAHFLLNIPKRDASTSEDANSSDREPILINSKMLFPPGVIIEESVWQDHHYLSARFSDGTGCLIWTSGSIDSFEVTPAPQQQVKLDIHCTWNPSAPDGQEYALSYAYTPGSPQPLNALLDAHVAHAPLSAFHLQRIHLMLEQSETAFKRYLSIGHVITPDPVINRAFAWAKVNQLRDQQEYRWGSGFSNNPPSDVVVGRDSVWYLAGSLYFAQNWSRRLLDFWLRHGIEPNGKLTEFVLASSDPLYKDDYGLNINDNTPLFLISAHQYYSLTADRGFLEQYYPNLLASAEYILSQRFVGEYNPGHLVWCTSKESFVRGLCGWRNCIRDYALSGAVTEINVQCCHALQMMAELSSAMNDEPNQQRFQSAAEDLRSAVEKHLRSTTPGNPFYILNITPEGFRRNDMTGDLVFPVLYGQTDQITGKRIIQELFSERFWVSCTDGLPGGGIRTVSAQEENYTPDADPASYGLLGGVWPNLALWAARAAAMVGLPDLTHKALRDTFLLTERENPAAYNVVPGELPEYFNGDDLKQRGHPRSTFLFGIYTWAVMESFLGIRPHADRLEINPVLPSGWEWAAVSRLPYHGCPLSMLAVAAEQTLYTTRQVATSWRQVLSSESIQQQFVFESDGEPFWIVAPCEGGFELLAANDQCTSGKLIDIRTQQILAEITIQPGCLFRQKLQRQPGK